MSSKTALVVIAEGCEEMEVVTTVDILRLCGIQVCLAGLNGSEPVTCSRGIIITPDKSLTAAIAGNQPYDAVVLPGGTDGAKKMCQSAELGKVLKEQYASGKTVAALCGGVTALKAHGVALGKSLTSYPIDKEDLQKVYKYSEARVVTDGNLITSRGPGTTLEYAFKVVETLQGKAFLEAVFKAEAASPQMLLPDGLIKL